MPVWKAPQRDIEVTLRGTLSPEAKNEVSGLIEGGVNYKEAIFRALFVSYRDATTSGPGFVVSENKPGPLISWRLTTTERALVFEFAYKLYCTIPIGPNLPTNEVVIDTPAGALPVAVAPNDPIIEHQAALKEIGAATWDHYTRSFAGEPEKPKPKDRIDALEFD